MVALVTGRSYVGGLREFGLAEWNPDCIMGRLLPRVLPFGRLVLPPVGRFSSSSLPQSRSGWLYDVDTTDAGCPSLPEERPGSAGLTAARNGDKFDA